MPNPRDFLEDIAKPSYQAWLADPLCEWKAKAAAGNADTMAERVFAYWKGKDHSQVAGAQRPLEYRTYLRRSVCPDFGLVWDVHDGHKHATLDRRNRQITSAMQTGVGRLGYGEGSYGDGEYGGSELIVIELDDGSKRTLSEVMRNVMAMWDRLLTDMDL